MVRFDSSSPRWYHQPTAIPMVILALGLVTKCQTLMVYMIWTMWVPYWNTTVPTVDNLCWCLFNKPHNAHSTKHPLLGYVQLKNSCGLPKTLFHFNSDNIYFNYFIDIWLFNSANFFFLSRKWREFLILKTQQQQT